MKKLILLFALAATLVAVSGCSNAGGNEPVKEGDYTAQPGPPGGGAKK
jgi:hypothetical protein